MKTRMEHFERRVEPIEVLQSEAPPPIEAALLKEIVAATCARLGLSPEQWGLPSPGDKK